MIPVDAGRGAARFLHEGLSRGVVARFSHNVAADWDLPRCSFTLRLRRFDGFCRKLTRPSCHDEALNVLPQLRESLVIARPLLSGTPMGLFDRHPYAALSMRPVP